MMRLLTALCARAGVRRGTGTMTTPEQMSTSEYQSFYDCGLMPERFWPQEWEKLADDFASDKITLRELEDSLDDLMVPIRCRHAGNPIWDRTAREREGPDS